LPICVDQFCSITVADQDEEFTLPVALQTLKNNGEAQNATQFLK